MESPEPVRAHRKLEKLAGHFSGPERMHPSYWNDENIKARAITDAQVALDGFAVVQDYAQQQDDGRHFAGHGVFRYDMPSDTYEMHWFDSTGGPARIFRGGFEGRLLVLTARLGEGWQRLTYDFNLDKGYRFRLETSDDGRQWNVALEGENFETAPKRRRSDGQSRARKATAKKTAAGNAASKKTPAKKAASKKTASMPKKAAAGKASPKKATARKKAGGRTTAKKARSIRAGSATAKKAAARKTYARKASAKKATAKKAASKKASAKKTAAKKAGAKKAAPRKATARKPAAKKAAARKTTAKKASAKKASAKKAGAKKAGAKKAGAKKAAPRKATARKSPAKKAAAKKATAKKATAKKASARKTAARKTAAGKKAGATTAAAKKKAAPRVSEVERRRRQGTASKKVRTRKGDEHRPEDRAAPPTKISQQKRKAGAQYGPRMPNLKKTSTRVGWHKTAAKGRREN